ncbi:molybdenum cofactor guanylyltransferase [Paenibacillus sp.]|uniref:molybdenum cofactor guanylyltransferase n=1 Tax=Paenibacillus sp. TaxID=58172 RepID=UPI002811D6DD|nr:molybdenum cofactor guanylyltransferase [Paenibacillus sp.]
MTGRSVVILAGGGSRRMGTDKWLLPVGGTPALGRLVGALDGVADDIAIVLPWGVDDALRSRAQAAAAVARPRTPVRWLADAEPDAGPLAGLAAAIAAGVGERCLVAAADLPFARTELAEALFRLCLASGADAAVPERGGRLHPLFAVYGASSFERLQAYRAGGGRRVMDWVSALRVATMREIETSAFDPEGTALFNMNTPDEYRRAQSLVDDSQFQ